MSIYIKHNKQAVNIKSFYSHLAVWLILQKKKQKNKQKHHLNKKPTPFQWKQKIKMEKLQWKVFSERLQ